MADSLRKRMARPRSRRAGTGSPRKPAGTAATSNRGTSQARRAFSADEVQAVLALAKAAESLAAAIERRG